MHHELKYEKTLIFTLEVLNCAVYSFYLLHCFSIFSQLWHSIVVSTKYLSVKLKKNLRLFSELFQKYKPLVHTIFIVLFFHCAGVER